MFLSFIIFYDVSFMYHNYHDNFPGNTRKNTELALKEIN